MDMCTHESRMIPPGWFRVAYSVGDAGVDKYLWIAPENLSDKYREVQRSTGNDEAQTGDPAFTSMLDAIRMEVMSGQAEARSEDWQLEEWLKSLGGLKPCVETLRKVGK